MPSPERGEQPHNKEQEQEPAPYYQAASYQNERPAKKAYIQAQKVIFNARGDVDLSVYRVLLNQLAHVVALGEEPPEKIHKRIQQILSSGTASTLPSDVLAQLLARRSQASKLGPWVEGHYRPGKRI